jgi:hypothetical protein
LLALDLGGDATAVDPLDRERELELLRAYGLLLLSVAVAISGHSLRAR